MMSSTPRRQQQTEQEQPAVAFAAATNGGFDLTTAPSSLCSFNSIFFVQAVLRAWHRAEYDSVQEALAKALCLPSPSSFRATAAAPSHHHHHSGSSSAVANRNGGGAGHGFGSVGGGGGGALLAGSVGGFDSSTALLSGGASALQSARTGPGSPLSPTAAAAKRSRPQSSSFRAPPHGATLSAEGGAGAAAAFGASSMTSLPTPPHTSGYTSGPPVIRKAHHNLPHRDGPPAPGATAATAQVGFFCDAVRYCTERCFTPLQAQCFLRLTHDTISDLISPSMQADAETLLMPESRHGIRAPGTPHGHDVSDGAALGPVVVGGGGNGSSGGGNGGPPTRLLHAFTARVHRFCRRSVVYGAPMGPTHPLDAAAVAAAQEAEALGAAADRAEAAAAAAVAAAAAASHAGAAAVDGESASAAASITTAPPLPSPLHAASSTQAPAAATVVLTDERGATAKEFVIDPVFSPTAARDIVRFFSENVFPRWRLYSCLGQTMGMADPVKVLVTIETVPPHVTLPPLRAAVPAAIYELRRARETVWAEAEAALLETYHQWLDERHRDIGAPYVTETSAAVRHDENARADDQRRAMRPAEYRRTLAVLTQTYAPVPIGSSAPHDQTTGGSVSEGQTGRAGAAGSPLGAGGAAKFAGKASVSAAAANKGSSSAASGGAKGAAVAAAAAAAAAVAATDSATASSPGAAAIDPLSTQGLAAAGIDEVTLKPLQRAQLDIERRIAALERTIGLAATAAALNGTIGYDRSSAPPSSANAGSGASKRR